MPPNCPFARPTIIAAANLLADFTHSEFDNLSLQFGLETRITSGTVVSKQVKANELSRVALILAAAIIDLCGPNLSFRWT